MDSHVKDTIANTTTIGGVAGVLMNWQAELTILVLLTGLILNITRIYTFFTNKNKHKDE